ncbi:hemolymph lipopolysaccharide-binding protein-like [Hetaerina americana]|uniref:hemolymph lipopolysaccharide-binding protein-like n=1 Tax=Hetaerina americana TaxID=62018 RepID=UPI003A7F1DCE
MIFNGKLLLATVLQLLFLQELLSQINELENISSMPMNKSLHLSITSRKNKTGHWVALFSVYSNGARLAAQWNADFNLNTRTNGSIESIHAIGAYAEAPKSDDQRPSRTVPARYTHYPGIGYYKLYNASQLTFYEAFFNCSVDGGHLAIINSQEEATLLRGFWSKFPTGGSFVFLGINDLQNPGDFRTIFGQTLAEAGYSEWAQNEPTGHGLCGFFDNNALLHSMSCNSKRPFLCEFPVFNKS